MSALSDLLNKITLGDCLPILRSLPDNAVDLILTDPPYGLKIDGQKENQTAKKRSQWRKFHPTRNWDAEPPGEELFRELHRVAKNVIAFGANYFCDHLEPGHKGWMVWDKGQDGLTMSDCEFIYSTFSHPSRMYRVFRTELSRDGTIHPTQKPLKLINAILADHAQKGQIVLDPFSGSGTTALAAHSLGLNFIAIERDPVYFRDSVERLNRHRAQLLLPLES